MVPGVTIVVTTRHRSMDISDPDAPLAIPAELRSTAVGPLDVAVIYDLDYLSHSGTGGSRVDDAVLALLTRVIEATASTCGTLCYVRAACSTETAAVHRLSLARAKNNVWQAVAGRHGADARVIAELLHLARTRRMRLVVLVGGDHAYAPSVTALRAADIAVWVLYRPGSLSWRLYQAATSATPLPTGRPLIKHPGCHSRVAALAERTDVNPG
jgi:hypothetical protein